jgi:hypothetical protein
MRTDLGGQSFGWWRVTHAKEDSARKNSVLEVRLTGTKVALIREDGQILESWPVDLVWFEDLGTADGCLRLGSTAIWLTSMEGRRASDLRNAVAELRGLPPVVREATVPHTTADD